ncbi:nuclear transport factor 2 family protein [Actinoplanes sp. M2I2]|uniref:nuclear transport factor 2 family protein n=1 Tax=Actinoplanes sp. M2I2 TaxID=1734444 RepID=UPI0020203211|nr:nuclear transport factor 2 family protein [Actinoplanes sp. M2I2]
MTATPAEVLQQAARRLLAKDMAGFIDLYADDAVMEFPFAPPGQPTEVAGRAALEGYLLHYPELLDLREFTVIALHETKDPEVIVAEIDASGFVVATGKPYELRYIAVLTIRDGLIVRYRDYWNPLVTRELLGGGLVR